MCENVFTSVTGGHHSFWLSATDIGQTQGQFRWLDETPVDASTWNDEQPDEFGPGKEACVFLHTDFAKLFDLDCQNKNVVIICEVPSALAFCVP